MSDTVCVTILPGGWSRHTFLKSVTLSNLCTQNHVRPRDTRSDVTASAREKQTASAAYRAHHLRLVFLNWAKPERTELSRFFSRQQNENNTGGDGVTSVSSATRETLTNSVCVCVCAYTGQRETERETDREETGQKRRVEKRTSVFVCVCVCVCVCASLVHASP